MAQLEDPRYIRVVCPKCRALLHPKVEQAGRHVKCPDCYSAVLVPQPPKPEAAPKQRDPGEYGLRGVLAPARPEKDGDDFFLVLCPTCQAHLHPRRSYAGKRARCPDCDTVFVIPSPPAPDAKPPPQSAGKYALGEEPQRQRADFRALIVEREREPEPKVPPEKWWFAAGVFTFPWWPEAWQRWLSLVLLLVPAQLMSGVVAFLAGAFDQGSKAATLIPFLILPLALFWLWALSYAAACFIAVVQDTGSGNDEIANWPEGDWRDRVGTLLYVGLHLGLAMAAASAISWPIGRVYGPIWMGLATALTTNFLFPLFLLGSMEADTLVVPYSPVIYRSLLSGFFCWVVVYIESLLVVAFAAGLVTAGLLWAPVATVFLASPLLATPIFILARLYGRLAWHLRP
jgi:DNA-directed RNA polymerase subunit RPC12/RpoP